MFRDFKKKKERSEEEGEEEETERRDAFLFETTEKNARATSCESCTRVLLLFFLISKRPFFSFFCASKVRRVDAFFPSGNIKKKRYTVDTSRTDREPSNQKKRRERDA